LTTREARALPQLLSDAAGVIFSGQSFCRAQSQNCEAKTPLARAAREIGDAADKTGMIVKAQTDNIRPWMAK